MDISVTELMRYLQLGMMDEALKSNTIWYCLSCQTCSARCPRGIDIAHIIDTMKIIVQEEQIKVDTKHARLLNGLWMNTLRYMGRMYELGLGGMFNMFTGKPFKDLPLGVRMIAKGKFKFLPSIRRPFETMKMFARARRSRK